VAEKRNPGGVESKSWAIVAREASGNSRCGAFIWVIGTLRRIAKKERVEGEAHPHRAV